jgi:hypothetical protein
MIITFSRMLSKIDDDIFIEKIFINPDSYLLKDDSRRISSWIHVIMARMSLADKYSVSKIEIGDLWRISEMIGNPYEEKMLYEFKIDYAPHMGKKKCSRCLYGLNKGQICYMRGCYIKNDFWANCVYYLERSEVKIL